MGKTVGIDLGTTNSVVTVPEKRDGALFHIHEEHSVILDQLKRKTQPSVVALGANGEILVGDRAKNRAGMTPSPIMFVKRKMGMDTTVPLGDRDLTPIEVSAEILAHLRNLAEEALGEAVDQAVITVPAHFNLLQNSQTKQAAELAGFAKVDLVMEPVAAALMYCANDDRDSLTIMTYDLGGGTFDVAILEKEDGVFDVKAFEGDRFLGGYNFDRAIAFHIINKLGDQGYDLDLDIDGKDRAAFMKLMVIAESAKKALSGSDVHEILEETGIMDNRGEPVRIDMIITRAEFEDLIREDVDSTIALAKRALEHKFGAISSDPHIDEVIMVGGSSRIPLVQKRVGEEFGITPKLIEPDLCIGLGASIKASTTSRSDGILTMEYIPASTDMDFVVVRGSVNPNGDSPAGWRAVLASADGSFNQTRDIASDLAFVFPRVSLAPNSETSFNLSILGADGSSLATHAFKVTHAFDSEDVAPPVTDFLSKPISIMTTRGLLEVAGERKELPYEGHVTVQTADQTGKLNIRIYEENVEQGQIVIDDLPLDLAIGTPVDVTLKIQKDFQIIGSAFIKSVGKDGHTLVQLVAPVPKTLAELKLEYKELNARAEDALSGASIGAAFSSAQRLKKGLEKVGRLMEESDPDLPRIQDSLSEISTLIAELGAGWQPEPSRDEVKQTIEDIKSLIIAIQAKAPEKKSEGFEQQLKDLEEKATDAFDRQSDADWAQANKGLVTLYGSLQRILKSLITPPEGDWPPPPPRLDIEQEIRKAHSALNDCKGQINRLTASASVTQAEVDKHKDECLALYRDCETALARIKADSPDAQSLLSDFYLTKLAKLKDRIERSATGGGIPTY